MNPLPHLNTAVFAYLHAKKKMGEMQKKKIYMCKQFMLQASLLCRGKLCF
jgi:hypothetical protein